MDFMDCIICKVEYNDKENNPIALICGHTLCAVCIKQVKDQNKNKCPHCSAPLDKFHARNYDLQNAIEWAQRALPILKAYEESKGELDLLRSYKKLGVKNPKQVQSILEEIMAK